MRRLTIAIISGLTVFGLVYGAAASLGVTADDIGTGSDTTIVACDADGVAVAFGLAAGDVSLISEVTISEIDDTTCAGQALFVEVVDDAGVATGSVASITATSHTVTLSRNANAETVSETNVTITGP